MANNDKELQFWYKCTKCNFKSGNSYNFKYHMESHKRNQRLKCPLCSFSSNIAFHISRHLKLHHHIYFPNIAQSHTKYLQEFNHAIEKLMNVSEKQLGNGIDGNKDPISNSVNDVVKNKNNGSSESTFKCKLCNYSTDNPANVELHNKAHSSDGSDKQFKCTLCNYSSNLKFVVIRHMNRDHKYIAPSNQENSNNTESRHESYLKAKTVELVFEPEPKKNPLRVCSWATIAEPEIPPKQRQEPRRQKVKIQYAEHLWRVNQCREQIHTARLSITKMRNRVKQQSEIRSEQEKRKEHLLHCLKFIENSNKKLADISIENQKLEILRNHIRDANKRKLESVLQLRALQLNELKSKKQLNEGVDEIVVIESNADEVIKCLKSHIKGMKNELKFLQEEERALSRDVELLNQSLNGVVNKVPDQMIEGLRLELGKVEEGIVTSIREMTEDMLYMLIVSTEEKLRNFLKFKRSLCPTYEWCS